MSNYYEDQTIVSAERVVLAEDIILTSKVIDYKGISGKFFFPILTPLMDQAKAQLTMHRAPSTKGHKGEKLVTFDYETTNYIQLYIPKYIIIGFSEIIPKGTEFLVVSAGGTMDLDDIRIIGIYTIPDNDTEEGESDE